MEACASTAALSSCWCRAGGPAEDVADQWQAGPIALHACRAGKTPHLGSPPALASCVPAAMDGSSLASLYREFSLARKVIDKDAAATSAKLCEVAKAYLVRKAKAAVAAAEARAILWTYGSDGTPMLCQTTITTQVQGQRTAVRKAGQAVEVLIERAFIKTTNAAGDLVMACLVSDPTPLTQGKPSWCHCTAAQRFFPMIRTLGHKGIVVSHYCFDRAIYSAASRKTQQRQCLYYEAVGGPSPREGEVALQELQDWHVSTACAAHDAHSALKRGMHGVVADVADVLKRLHIVIHSLRNAYNLLHYHLKDFVSSAVAFSQEAHGPQVVFERWRALGVEDDARGGLGGPQLALGRWPAADIGGAQTGRRPARERVLVHVARVPVPEVLRQSVDHRGSGLPELAGRVGRWSAGLGLSDQAEPPRVGLLHPRLRAAERGGPQVCCGGGVGLESA